MAATSYVRPLETIGKGQFSALGTTPGRLISPTWNLVSLTYSVSYGFVTRLLQQVDTSLCRPVSERRRAILSRAPSRARISALMKTLPSCDAWLDDKYDQTP